MSKNRIALYMAKRAPEMTAGKLVFTIDGETGGWALNPFERKLLAVTPAVFKNARRDEFDIKS